MWLLKATAIAVVLTAKTCAQYGSSSASTIRGGSVSPYGTGFGYGGYPSVGSGLGSMTGYPGYGMGLGGMGYPGLGMQGYGGTINPYGPMMDYSGVYSGSTLGSPFWNLYGSSLGGFGTDTSLASLNRPFTTRQKESSKATATQ
ncbi:hypothetical protein Tcan_03711 [Toxocara canis]|uniref:Uncharacterized protein n=1 Tax=Toxocara canis TaxID=6265 RepID=A0A0B2VI70_TOXCA|nr:hypothetical protein Tcan_03711 [Toxocara canis]